MENGMKYFSSTVRQSGWQILLPVNPNAAREKTAWFKGSPTQLATPHRGMLDGCWGRMDSICHRDRKWTRILTTICQAEYPSPNYFLRARNHGVLLFSVSGIETTVLPQRGVPHDLTLVTSGLRSQTGWNSGLLTQQASVTSPAG